MWKDLSMREKAALMRVAIKNGIYGLKEIRNRYDEGGPLKPSFEDWYKTVPVNRNDTTQYNLRRAYQLLPFEELERWRTATPEQLNNINYHLRSVAPNEQGDYEFLKSKYHKTYNKEIEWYNSDDAKDFRKEYILDNTEEYPKYKRKSRNNSFAKGGPINIGEEQRQRYEAGLPSVSTEDNPIIFDYNEEARKLAELEKQQMKELNSIPEIIELENKGIKRYNNSYGKYFIPHIKDKEIKLTNAGSMTGTKLSTNVLDSLYHYSKKVDIPLVDAMGLPAQESTFGAGYNHTNPYKNDEYGYNPIELLSDWSFAPPVEAEWNPRLYDNPILRFQPKESQEELNAIENFNKAYENNSDDAYYYSKLLNVLGNKNKLNFYKSNKKGLKKLVDNYDENYPPIQHAFELFKLGKYNTGDPDYKNKVRRKGNEIINSPEFKAWARKNNIKL